MRAFVALDLPDGLIGSVTRLQAGLSVGRPVPEENLHLTLSFLGEISLEVARDVAEGLAGLSAAPVSLALAGVDVPGGRAPNLVWIGAEANDALVGLQAKVARIVREAGVVLERRRFRPHVTLARFPRDLSPKDSRGIGEFLALNGAVRFDPEPADRVTLYQSWMGPEGSVYEPLAEQYLAG